MPRNNNKPLASTWNSRLYNHFPCGKFINNMRSESQRNVVKRCHWKVCEYCRESWDGDYRGFMDSTISETKFEDKKKCTSSTSFRDAKLGINKKEKE